LSSSHSWVVQVGSGTDAGRSRGGFTGGDAQSQRYFCPLDNLEDCQPDPKHGIRLSAEALRPCRKGVSAQFAKIAKDNKLFISWMGNGHVDNGQSDGTCVRLMLAEFAEDPSFADFKELPGGSCIPYWHFNSDGIPETSAWIDLPADVSEGKHTLLGTGTLPISGIAVAPTSISCPKEVGVTISRQMSLQQLKSNKGE